MRVGRILAALVVASSAASPAAASEYLLATHAPSGAKVYVQRQGGRVHVRSIGPASVLVNFNFDADASGSIDPAVDVAYGFQRNGTLCPQQWLTESSWSYCGVLKSGARGSVETIGDMAIRRLDLPLAEVARDGRGFGFKIGFYVDRKGTTYVGGRHDLATGSVSPMTFAPAAAAKPATASPAATPAAPGLTDRQLTDRHETAKEFYNKVCSYRQLPEIRLLNNAFTGLSGKFMVRSVESDSIYNNDLSVSITPNGAAKARIVVTDRAKHVRTRIKHAELVLGDGRRFALRPVHPVDRSGAETSYQPFVTVEDNSRDLVEAMAQNSTARLVLGTDQGEVSRWNFRIGNLRYLKPAMEKSQWKCTGAW